MKVLGLIEKDLDIVSKEHVDEKFSNHQMHLEELDKKWVLIILSLKS